MKKALVIGGGFAGVKAAIDLHKSGSFEVTLVSDRPFMYLFPISIWVPVRAINEDKVKIPLEEVSKKHGFHLIVDKVSAIVSAENKVICSQQSISYDYLVVALGSDKIQMQGMEHTTTICGKPEQTLALRSQIDELIAKGSGKIAVGFGGNPKDKSAVRGGPAFELIFNIDHYLRKLGLRDKFHLNMFAPMETPGARMGQKAMQASFKRLKAKGVAMHFGKKIAGFTAEGIRFEDDTILQADIKMFISAGTGSAVFKNSDLPLSEAGFVSIDEHCQVEGLPNVYAIGDAAALQGPKWAAKQGHIAEVMASVAAHNMLQAEGKTTKKKSYTGHLSILCIMDVGNGAVLVYRNSKKQIMIPLPIVGHWLKQAWGRYARWTKL